MRFERNGALYSPAGRPGTGGGGPIVSTPSSYIPNYWQGSDFLSSPNWTILDRAGDGSNGELQGFDPAHVTYNGTYLQIKSEKVASHGLSYASGMLQFAVGTTFTHGSIEIRCQMPGGTGLWPALWMLGQNCQATNPTTPDNTTGTNACIWPNVGNLSDEIDIVELLNGQRTTGNFQVHNDGGNDQATSTFGFDSSAGMHVYLFERSSGLITLKVDGGSTPVASLSGAHISDTPMGFIIGVAVGGVGGGTVTDSSLPQVMLVDYVRKIDLP